MTELYLYVWEEFCPDYTDGLAFAIAQDEEEARGLVSEHMKLSPSVIKWGKLNLYPLTSKMAKAIHGGG